MATATINAPQLSGQAMAAQVGEDCTHVSLWDAAMDGNKLLDGAINTNPDPLVLGGRFEVGGDMSAFVITYLPAAHETETWARRLLAGGVGTGFWVQFHDGAPGADGTANVIAVSRAEVTSAEVTIA